MRGRTIVACLAVALGACEQTVVLDDDVADGGSHRDSSSPFGDGSSVDGRCPGNESPQPVPFTAEVAETVVALDRSTAMNAAFGGADDTQVGAALDALTAIVQSYEPDPTPHNQHAIHFAFVDFPDTAPDCMASAGCCPSDVTQTTSYEAFDQVAYACSIAGTCIEQSQRPTGIALAKADDFLSFSNNLPAGPRYVLLVTDGPPEGGCSNTPNDCSDAIREIGSLTNLGVETVIVGIGDQSNEGCLLDLASAEGATQPPYYYPAASQNDLISALGASIAAMASSACHLDLGDAPGNPNQVTVEYDGTTILRDNTNGWSFDSGNTRITLNGTACQDLIEGGSQSFQVFDGCGGRNGP